MELLEAKTIITDRARPGATDSWEVKVIKWREGKEVPEGCCLKAPGGYVSRKPRRKKAIIPQSPSSEPPSASSEATEDECQRAFVNPNRFDVFKRLDEPDCKGETLEEGK